MDLESALAFFVVATAVLSSVAAIRMKAWRWLGVQLANLAIVGAAWTFARAWFIEIVAPVWVLTVLAPSLATSASDRFTRAERFGLASALARIASTLHPTPATRLRALLAAAQRAEQTGRREELPARLARLAAAPGGATLARLLELREDNRWTEIREWLESQPGVLGTDPVALTFLLRAQGEVGDVDALVRTLVIAQTTPAFAAVEGQALLFATAFGGKEAALDAVLDAFHAEMPERTRRLWRLTAARAAGKDVDAELRALAQDAAPRIAALALRRLETPRAEPSRLTAIALDTLAERVAKLEPARVPRPSATAVIVAINVYVFLRELPGGATSDSNLMRLGALQTNLLGDPAELYRLFTATVLHAGWAHVSMNMLGLLVLGRPLEAAVGRARFVAIYVLAGIGANVLYVPFTHFMHKPPEPVVGASGCVMAVAGALLVRRIVRWRERKTRIARGEVVWLLMLLVVQTAFDATQREVAGSVHLFGAGLGALLAIVLGRPKKAAPQPTTRARIVAVMAAIAGALGMEAIWAAAGPHGDAKACHGGDLEACQRDCDAALAPGGRRGHWSIESCNVHAAHLAQDGNPDGARTSRAIFATTCDAGNTLGCVAEAMVSEHVDIASCEQGDTDACERSCVRLYGPSVREDPPVLGEPSKKRGDGVAAVSACVRWAYAMSTRRDAGPSDSARAYTIYVTACDAGNDVACTNEGVMLQTGEGVDSDEAAALELFRRTCDAGHARACTYYGEALLRDGGLGPARAALEYACDASDDRACTTLDRFRAVTR
ncbi:MAG TPA: rhomboid family intramembrane serine protease [Labilithrix sp.]